MGERRIVDELYWTTVKLESNSADLTREFTFCTVEFVSGSETVTIARTDLSAHRLPNSVLLSRATVVMVTTDTMEIDAHWWDGKLGDATSTVYRPVKVICLGPRTRQRIDCS